MITGICVSSLMTLSKLRSKAPPPVSTMPLSMMSAANSGGVFSKVFFTESTIAETVSLNALDISSAVISIVFGNPVNRSRPRISMFSTPSVSPAEPISILIASAVRSPIIKL
ncbi:hypothetical protein SRABI80_04763 [Peribacillus frigoritolerans]|nr:hypothetical protein SRABI80_04763 [Peribacillus frigoritolerans]